VAALLSHTGHAITNGVTGVTVCLIFFSFNLKKMMKKNKSKKAKPGDKSRASKRKASSQQSAPLASAISTMEKAKKPKVVSEGTSATNVAEDD
jgi:hypothetical protein